jgi:hypothetical protein
VSSQVSWKNYYPEFDSQTKSELIEEAKDEIIRIFPDVDESTLDGYWKDHDLYSDLPDIGPSRIVFTNVDDTSGEFIEARKIRSGGFEQNVHNNIVTIKVDPESGDMVFYGSEGMLMPLEEETRTVSFEEAADRAVEFVKYVKGDDFYEEKGDEIYISKTNSDALNGYGETCITLYNTYKGVQYLNDEIFVRYDLILDRVVIYSDELKNPELMKSLTTLSPVPDISEDEAKEILEAKLKENFPGEELDIQYTVWNGHENSLNWYDDKLLFYADQPEPIRLIWYVTFSDEKMREKDSRMATPAIIDAHTGEIVSLNFRDINIS